MKKSILIIHDYPHSEGGGVEVQGFLDAKEFVLRGYKATIATTRHISETYVGTYDGEIKAQKDGVDFAVIKNSVDLGILIDNADVVHVRATFSLREGTMEALRLLTKKKRKYIISIHTNYNHIYFGSLSQKTEEEKQKLLSRFSSYLSSRYASIVGVSKSLRGSLDKIGVKKDFTVIHNAKDWSAFQPSGEANKISKVDITYIGEVSCMKGVHTLLGATLLLKKDMPRVKVRIIGSGTSKVECVSIVNALDLGKNVECIDYVENKKMPDFFVRTKILVLPSFTESWGNVVMEAMGLGTTTVSSRVEGLIELTENGKLGFLCESGNTKDLSVVLNEILDEKIKLPTDEVMIQKIVRKKYSLKNRIDKLEEIYKKALGGSVSK